MISFKLNFYGTVPLVGEKMVLQGIDYKIMSIDKVSEHEDEYEVIGTMQAAE